jgi:hypothetical protein
VTRPFFAAGTPHPHVSVSLRKEETMGHNRGGDDRKARLKRRKKEMERLANKAAQASPAPGAGGKAAAAPPPAPAKTGG